MSKTLRVLCIDGGGIRGVIPAELINHIEKNVIKKPLSEHFDLFAGTSTGALIAAMLAYKKSTGDYLVNTMYSYKNANIIMNKSYLDKIFGIAQIHSKYEDDGKSKIIQRYTTVYGEPLLLKNTLPNKYFMTCAYDVTHGKLKFFKSWDLRDENYTLYDVLCSTSAAPSYFPMHQMKVGDEIINYADGGLFANNLTDSVGIELLGTKFKGYDNIEIMSLGTGAVPPPMPNIKSPSWGGIPWLKNGLIDIIFAGAIEAANYKMKVLSETNGWKYLRINKNMTIASQEMDNVSQENIKNLALEADSWINDDIIMTKLLDFFNLQKEDVIERNNSETSSENDILQSKDSIRMLNSSIQL